MRNLSYIAAVGLVALTLTAVAAGPGFTGKAWGQEFGMISAMVAKTDSSRGLVVRSEPSDSGQAVGYLAEGTEVRGCNDFKDGWMRLQIPVSGGWVNMANLKPVGGDAKVMAVEKPDLCLPVRKGPGNWYEKTGCFDVGQTVQLTGVWSVNNWAQVAGGGWIDASKIETDLVACEAPTGPPAAEAQPPAAPSSPTYVTQNYSYAAPSYEYAAPYFWGDYGGFGYYPTAYPFFPLVILNRHGRHFHHIVRTGHWNRSGAWNHTRVNAGPTMRNLNRSGFTSASNFTNANRFRANSNPALRWNTNRTFSGNSVRSFRSFTPRSSSTWAARSVHIPSGGFRARSFSGGSSFRGFSGFHAGGGGRHR